MRDDTGGHRSSGRPGIRHRIRYRFDNLLARGTSATLIWLGLVTAAAVLVSSLLLVVAGVTLAGSSDESWLEDVWQSLLRVMDPGTMASDVGWGRRLLALLITIFGLLVAGTLIGIMAAAVEDRIDRMRRGRSVVIESDHVVVLGASDRLPVLLRQLVLADDGTTRRRTIVVLADLDPAEIHAAAQGAADPTGRTKIVYRSGDPTDPDDLALTSLPTARAAIVLSDRRSDRAAIETVLAIGAELGDLDHLTVAVELLEDESRRRLHRAYGSTVHSIVTADAVARTVAFALRQRGLSRVVDELLDFRGSDIHVVERPDAVGAPFVSIVRSWTNARPIGLRRADGGIELNPGLDTRIGPGDRIVVVADDIGRIEVHAPSGELVHGSDDRHGHPVPPVAGPAPERLVIIGWNDLGALVLAGWAASASPDSSVEVVVDQRWGEPEEFVVPDLAHISFSWTAVDDVIADTLGRHPTTVVLLGPPADEPDSDIGTILDLNALRRELGTTGTPPPRIVVELRDAAHQELVDLAGPDDLVISDAMGSQFIAQLADEPLRRDVLLQLYAEQGATMRLVRCDDLGLVGQQVIADVVDRCAAHGLLLIGWRRSAAEGGDVTLNPRLTSHADLGTDDELVVID